jgi:hypothetical protein
MACGVLLTERKIWRIHKYLRDLVRACYQEFAFYFRSFSTDLRSDAVEFPVKVTPIPRMRSARWLPTLDTSGERAEIVRQRVLLSRE